MSRTPNTYLFYLGHPAHYHNVKNLAAILTARADKVYFIARRKDVLFQLLRNCPFPVRYLTREKKGGRLGQLSFILYRFRKMFLIAREVKPDIIIGTDVVTTWIARLNRIPSVILNEDDLHQVPLMKHGLRFCTASIAPTGCDHGPFEEKQISYNGVQESAYLHPKYFEADKSIVEKFHASDAPYYILRFAALSAHHDVGKKGIDDQQAMTLVHLLEAKGKVYITSERELSSDLESRRIKINPQDIHHALAYAEMYIGDSQTMAAEAALLGTPSLRYNDFVGKLTYLETLEHDFHLTKGVRVGSFDVLLQTVQAWLESTDLKDQWRSKALNFFNQTEEVNGRWLTELDRMTKPSGSRA